MGWGEEGRVGGLEWFKRAGKKLCTVKIILGSTRKYHKGGRKIRALFSGSKGALTPPPPPPTHTHTHTHTPPREGPHIRDLSVGIEI